VGVLFAIVARMIEPLRNPLDPLATAALGVLGAFAGGGLVYALHWGAAPNEAGGWIMAATGSALFLSLGWISAVRWTTDDNRW
jgi:uncharacterized membrane protein YeaQ/YmgE (transglycosylase-associated protein family)